MKKTPQTYLILFSVLLLIIAASPVSHAQQPPFQPVVQTGHPNIWDLRLSPSGRYGVSTALNKQIVIWDLVLLKQIATYALEETPKVIEFSSDEKFLYSLDSYGRLQKWDISNGDFTEILPRGKGDISWAKIWTDNESVLVVGNDHFSILELSTGKTLKSKVVYESKGFLKKGTRNQPMKELIFTFIFWGNQGKKVLVLDDETFDIKYELPYFATDLVFSEVNNTLIMINLKASQLAWFDMNTQKLDIIDCESCSDVRISPDQKRLLVYAAPSFETTSNIQLFDIEKRQKIKSFPFDNQYNSRFEFISDDRLLMTTTWKGMHIIDINNNQFVKSFYPAILEIVDMGYDITTDQLATHHKDTIYLWDRRMQRASTKLVNARPGFREAHFGLFPNYTSNSDAAKEKAGQLTTKEQRDEIAEKICNLSWNGNLESIRPLATEVYMFRSSHDEKSVFIGKKKLKNTGDKLSFYQFYPKSNELIGYDGHYQDTYFAEESADGRHVYSADFHNQIKLWDRATQQLLTTSYVFNTNGFITITPDGYYTTSLTAVDEVVFARGLEAYTFENFDLVYNRPDIIAERLGVASPEFVSILKKAWVKRLKRYGLTEEQVNKQVDLPKLSINTSDIALETTKKVIELPVNVTSTQSLNRYIVTVNGVPLNHSPALEINGVSDSRSLKVELTAGENRIKVICLNNSGFKSLSQSISINYTKPAIQPNLYLLSIGVSEFKQKDFNLTYADKDAKDVVTHFENGSKYGKVISLPMLNKDANLKAFESIKKQLKGARPEDHMIVFVASHGLLSDDLDYYLAMNDIDFESPSKGGLLYENLESIFKISNARNRLVLLDACHSGEVDKEETTVVSASAQPNANVNSRGFKTIKSTSKKVDLQSSFDLMKELFVDLQQSTGATVISSASGEEYAYESAEWNNGVFTYALLQGLKTNAADKNKDGQIRVSEIQDYVYQQVKVLTNGKQNPTSRTENTENDFVVW